MSKKAEIKKIVLDLGGKEVELSVDQAKKLYDLLGEMYGEKVVVMPSCPIIIERSRPYWTWEGPIWTSDGYQITYTATDQTAYCSI